MASASGPTSPVTSTSSPTVTPPLSYPAPLGPPRPPAPPLWPPPAQPLPRFTLVALVVLVVAGLVLGGVTRPGIGVPLLALAVAGVVVPLLWRERDVADRLLLGLAVALCGVAAVRDSAWLVVLCLLGALGLVAAVAVGARRWAAVLLSPVAVAGGSLRSLPWVVRAVALVRPTRSVALGAWLRGSVLGLVLMWVIGGLLASADAGFARVIALLTPRLDVSDLPARVLVTGFVVALALGIAFCAAAPPTWTHLQLPAVRRPVAEWAVPLAAVDAVLGLFVVLQAPQLFGGAELVAVPGVTFADRARQGFGQLVAVTILVALTVSLAAYSAGRDGGSDANADARLRRRLLGGLGGVQIALTLAVVGSALRRMALYEQAYGWTVLRVVVAAFELWLAAALVVLAVAWLLRRTAGGARLVVACAGVGLLTLGLAGPDALVARLDVDRFRATGRVDVDYLRTLSHDAVPALDRLPEPQRSQVLCIWVVPNDAWPGANLARYQARTVLAARPAQPSCLVRSSSD